MRNRQLFIALAASVAFGSLGASADAKLANPSACSVSFTATGPAGMKITGTTADLHVADDGQNVVIQVPLANLTTGISLRDKHMRDKYLEVGQYPNAELTVVRSTLHFPETGDVSGEAQGIVTIHGKSKPTTFHYVAHKGAHLRVEGTVHVNMNDHAMVVPSYLGVSVKPDVEIAVHFDVENLL